MFAITKKSYASDYTEIQRITKITVADSSTFAVDGAISGDGVAGNDGIGVIQKKVAATHELWIIMTSGSFVAGNNVDNTAVYVAPATAIASLDSEYFEVSHYVCNPNTNTVSIICSFVKNVSDFTLLAHYAVEDEVDEYFPEQVEDIAFNIVDHTKAVLTGSGNYRSIHNVMRCEPYMKWIITPTNMAGTDTIVLAVIEDALGRLGN